MEKLLPSYDSGLPLSFGKIVLRLMRRDDVGDMAAWPYHLDPFFSRGVRMPATISGRDRWWAEHFRPPLSILLGAEDRRGLLIGRISVTVVDERAGEGIMGCRIRPELENRGLGTDMIRAFLQYWFEYRQMRRLTFDANVLNRRAIACYAKVGVPIVGHHYDYHPQYLHEPKMHASGFMKYFDYRIDRDEYFAQKQTKQIKG